MQVCANLPPAGRDFRLDLFRGLANWAIFLDHIPHEVLNWITIKNYGFSDAADLFVFISGYTAAFVFGRVMIERGYLAAASRLVKRALQLYAAHILVVVVYSAVIAGVAQGTHDANDLNASNVAAFITKAALGIRSDAGPCDTGPSIRTCFPLYISCYWERLLRRCG
jgi:hypothetical protein